LILFQILSYAFMYRIIHLPTYHHEHLYIWIYGRYIYVCIYTLGSICSGQSFITHFRLTLWARILRKEWKRSSRWVTSRGRSSCTRVSCSTQIRPFTTTRYVIQVCRRNVKSSIPTFWSTQIKLFTSYVIQVRQVVYKCLQMFWPQLSPNACNIQNFIYLFLNLGKIMSMA
jgi:hypothetical protein